MVRPLESAGLYVPGGAGAYPSSVLMNAIPARVAGVPRLVVVTPPRASESSPAVAAALVIVGLEGSVYRVGGAQAVAALAHGTETVPAVSKIVGPGNAFVAEAKRQVRGLVEIDREAGPSEVVVLADETADPGHVAADLLAQAEHGSGDETVVLVTPSRELGAGGRRAWWREGLPSVANVGPRRGARSRRRGCVVLVRDVEQGIAAVNALAPEHAQVMTRGAASGGATDHGGGGLRRRVVARCGRGLRHRPQPRAAHGRRRPLRVALVRPRLRKAAEPGAGHPSRPLRALAEDVVRVARAEGFPGHAQSVLTRFASAKEVR